MCRYRGTDGTLVVSIVSATGEIGAVDMSASDRVDSIAITATTRKKGEVRDQVLRRVASQYVVKSNDCALDPQSHSDRVKMHKWHRKKNSRLATMKRPIHNF